MKRRLFNMREAPQIPCMQQPRHPSPSEAGVILALFVVSLPIILSLSVLALDAGYLYLTRSRLDKASRAASATALNMLALKGWGSMVAMNRDNLGFQTADALNSDGSPKNETAANREVRNQMKIAAVAAVKKYFPADSFQESDITFCYSQDQACEASPPLKSLDLKLTSVKLQLRFKVPTLILGAITSSLGGTSCISDGKHCFVKSAFSTQSGYMKPANIFMLLDTSGSMNATASGGRSKIEVLKEAAGGFIDMFNPYKDRISLIEFGTTVKSSTSLANFSAAENSSTPKHLGIKRTIEALQPGGQTNPSDALIEVIRLIDTANLGADATTFALLFTDGAPNVFRLDFHDQTTLGKISKTAPAGTENRGWYGWTVKWGERELARELNCQPNDARQAECDPVWGWPQVFTNQGEAKPLREIQEKLRLDQDGKFLWKGSRGWQPLELADGGHTLRWKSKSTAEDNYKWYGPSYLVHASETIPPGLSLIDRIPRSIKENPITCGTGSRGGRHGHRVGTFTDMYNHSRYFASRVINSSWTLDHPTTSNGARRLVGLGLLGSVGSSEIAAPAHFAREIANGNRPGEIDPPSGGKQPVKDSPGHNPGCLSSLNASLPGLTKNGEPDQSHSIYVGQSDATLGNLSPSIVANVDASSVAEVGEVVKTAELPYYAAIRAADYLRRERNVTIFTVGLGPSATHKYSSTCNDAMQNALDFDSRKDNFLRRLALAPESLEAPAAFMRGGTTTWSSHSDFGYISAKNNSTEIKDCRGHPLLGKKITRGYAEQTDTRQTSGAPLPNSPAVNEFRPTHLGAYYGSNDTSQLKGLFGKIAKEMLLRLST